MGYSDGECLSCYCDGGGESRDGKAWTCLKCIHYITKRHQRVERVRNAISNWMNYSECGRCEKCGKEHRMILEVPTCQYHRPQPKTSTEYDEELSNSN
jgi:hypothetical protein